MRAVKIDPVSRTVTEINLKKNPNRTLDELYNIIGCDLVELVQIDADMVMVCDEEGKCKEAVERSPLSAVAWSSPGLPLSSAAMVTASRLCRRTSHRFR